MNKLHKKHLFRDSLLWKALAAYIFFLHRLFYQAIVVEGKEKIPGTGPLIFAPNHQNALMDPLAVLYASARQIVFLARADIFRNRLLRPLLHWMKILPVYRIRDGVENLHQNEASFDTVTEVLEHGRSIGLFPEAAHSGKMHLLPLKKGVPRLAFLTEAKHDFSLGVQVVPVGIYYSHYYSMGSVLHVRFGEPVQVAKYRGAYLDNPQKAHLALRDDLAGALRQLAIDIRDLDWYEAYDTVLILRTRKLARGMDPGKNIRIREFESRKRIIDILDRQLKEQPGRMQRLRDKVEAFLGRAKDLNIRGNLLAEPLRGLPRLLGTTFLWLLCLPLFLYALVNHLPGYFIPRLLVRRFKDKQFHSSVKFLWGAFFLPLFYLLQSLMVLLVFKNNWMALYYALSLPVSGLLAHWLYRKGRVLAGRWRLFRLRQTDPADFRAFVDLRESILSDIDFLLNL